MIQPRISIFLFMFMICGALWGLLEAYFFWFLEVVS